MRPQSHAHEKDDCTVQALATVLGISYKSSHEMLKKSGRKDCCAASPTDYFPVYESFAKGVRIVGQTAGALWLKNNFPQIKCLGGLTIQSFLDKVGSNGKYIILTNDHAMAVVDGFVYNLESNTILKNVIAIFKF